ncbi:hypothetical protein [Chryseobacterium sp. Mn2064]|uniref:hypothetical protein n=1 Tax=Chryseobacterium sp. Mn2064 TaxID=3395263 RepID=UPI003BE7EC57
MKIRVVIILSLSLLLTSCQYSEKQQKMIQQIATSSNAIYENAFRKNLLVELSKRDIVQLSSHENQKVALYFFRILVEKYPEACFEVLIKNLNNKKTLDVHTSYDTIEELTVPDAMMFYSISKKDIFTKEQKEKLFGIIINNFEQQSHLEGYLFLYLDDHKNTPDPQYYQPLRKLMEKKRDNRLYGNSTLLNYMANYNKPQDSLLIKDFLYQTANGSMNAPTHMNPAVDFIKNHPKPSYFPILEEFYNKQVKGKAFSAYDSFFELEDLTIATLQYKTEKARQLLKNIAFHTTYKPEESGTAINEHLYFLLKKYDSSNYFSEISNAISPKINKVKMDSVVSKHDRWDRYIH